MRKMTGGSVADAQTILDNVGEIACEFASQRSERQRRRGLEKEDFDRLKESGYPLVAVPTEFGGIWEGDKIGTRQVCEILKTLADSFYAVNHSGLWLLEFYTARNTVWGKHA